MPRSHLHIHVKQSRKFANWSWMWLYIVEVTGSILHGNYRVNVAVMESARQPSSKGVFSREREWFTKNVNVEKLAKSNIRTLGSNSLPNMRGVRKRHQLFMRGGSESVINCSCAGVQKRHQLFVGCWKHLQEISNFLNIPTELKTTPANNWRTPTHVWQTFGAWNTNVRLCHFFDIRILRESFAFPWKHTFSAAQTPHSISQKFPCFYGTTLREGMTAA